MKKLKILAVAVAMALVEPLMKLFEKGVPKFHLQPGMLHAIAKSSDVALGMQPMPTPVGSDLVCVRLVVDLTAAPALNDTLYMGDLPEDCVPVDCILDSTDIDTNGAPAVTLSPGFLNAAKTDLDGTAWIVASTIGQAGGMARPTTNTLVKSGTSSARRPFGVKVTAAAATFAAGQVGLTLMYRSAHFGR